MSPGTILDRYSVSIPRLVLCQFLALVGFLLLWLFVLPSPQAHAAAAECYTAERTNMGQPTGNYLKQSSCPAGVYTDINGSEINNAQIDKCYLFITAGIGGSVYEEKTCSTLRGSAASPPASSERTITNTECFAETAVLTNLGHPTGETKMTSSGACIVKANVSYQSSGGQSISEPVASRCYLQTQAGNTTITGGATRPTVYSERTCSSLRQAVSVSQGEVQGTVCYSDLVTSGGISGPDNSTRATKNLGACVSSANVYYYDSAGNEIDNPAPPLCYLDSGEVRHFRKVYREVNCNEAEAAAVAGTSLTATSAGNEEEQQSCEDNDGEFVFFQCAIIRFASGAVNEMDSRVRNALEVNPLYYEDDGLRGAWANFRNIAYILLIPALLLMVIGTALGFSFVDAYTVKRALPRLLMAIIFIALSYEICVFLIEVIDVIGKGVGGLIAAPFGGSDELVLTNIFNPSALSGAAALGVGVIGGIALIGVGAVTLGILASYLLVAALALIIIFALLTMREVIIVFLIILAPVAIISWIFPNNDKVWKLWWNSFSKLLLLYPIIVGLLVVGRAFALIISEIPAEGAEQVFLTFAKLVAYIGPFFFIPTIFRYAGGAFANLAGLVNNRSKGVFDRQRKYRGENRAATKKRAKEEGKRFENGPDWLNKRVQRGLYAGAGGLAVGKKRSGRIDSAIQTSDNALRKALMEDQAIATWAGDDDVAGPIADIMNGDRENIKNLLRRKNFGAKRDADGNTVKDADGNTVFDESRIDAKASEILKPQSLESALSTTFAATGKYMNDDGTEDTAAKSAALGHVGAARKKYGDNAFKQAMVLKAMAGGTYYENETDTWRAAGLAAGNDQAAAADMVVKGRSALMSAGRAEEGAGSFGKTLTLQSELAKLDPKSTTYKTDVENLRFKFASHVIDNNPASTLVHASMKAGYLEKNIIPVLQRRMQEAVASGDQDVILKETALAESIHSQIKATKPDLANLFGQQYMAFSPEVGRVLTASEESASQAAMTTYRDSLVAYQSEMDKYHIAQQNQQADIRSGKTVTPIPVPVKPVKPHIPSTVRMQTFEYAQDPRYQNYSRQWQGAEDQARAQQAQALAVQQGQGPGGGPVGGAPPVPPLP